MDYIRRCALVRAVRREAERWGYRGDLFAERVPLVGSVQQQHHLATIYVDVRPRPRTDKEREFVKRLCRAAVLGKQPESPARATAISSPASIRVRRRLW